MPTTGYIPNGAFTGNVSTNGNQGSVLSLLVDTGNLPTSFSNLICFQYDADFGECQGGIAPGAGGLITLSFTKIREWKITLTCRSYVASRLSAGGLDDQSTFAAQVRGTVFGLTINTQGIDPYLDWMWTDTNSLNVKQKFLLAEASTGSEAVNLTAINCVYDVTERKRAEEALVERSGLDGRRAEAYRGVRWTP